MGEADPSLECAEELECVEQLQTFDRSPDMAEDAATLLLMMSQSMEPAAAERAAAKLEDPGGSTSSSCYEAIYAGTYLTQQVALPRLLIGMLRSQPGNRCARRQIGKCGVGGEGRSTGGAGSAWAELCAAPPSARS